MRSRITSKRCYLHQKFCLIFLNAGLEYCEPLKKRMLRRWCFLSPIRYLKQLSPRLLVVEFRDFRKNRCGQPLAVARPPQNDAAGRILFYGIFSAFFFKKSEIAAEFRDFPCGNLFVVKFIRFLDYERQNFKTEGKFFVHQVFVIPCFD